LLGGEIRLVSIQGEGSTFTLYLPLNYTGPSQAGITSIGGVPSPQVQAMLPVLPVAPAEELIADDRNAIDQGDLAPLAGEDVPHYARVLPGLARDRGLKGVGATRGHQAMALARQLRPTAITLDIFLPDMLGWTVLNNLKLDPATRHIPVQIISLEE